MPIDKRKVQEINAGSMADIAFLLLIFFLVATTMNVDTGIARNLPPMPPEDQKVEDMKVKIRNLLPVLVNGRGDIFVGRAGEQEYVDIHQLKDRAKDFLLNVMDDPNLPEKEVGKAVDVTNKAADKASSFVKEKEIDKKAMKAAKNAEKGIKIAGNKIGEVAGEIVAGYKSKAGGTSSGTSSTGSTAPDIIVDAKDIKEHVSDEE